jgi:predicted RNase H-like nuclease
MTNTRFIGIDGCKAGWFCVLLDNSEQWSYQVLPDAIAAAKLIRSANSVLIDIPIGLLSEGPDERLCDKTARKLLGVKRASSVFPAPARQALAAGNYQQALVVNRKSISRGLSRQAWNIVPKIRQIDQLLRSQSELQGILRECHPELCFWALNNENAMQFNKKTEQGRYERLAVLERYFPDCHSLFEQASSEYLRRQVAYDDIIDAMVCAVTAQSGYGKYLTVPKKPDRDRIGLPMQMVYWPA